MEVVAQRLVVGEQEIAVVLVLEFDPVVERAYVVAQMQCAGGSDTGEDSFLCWRCHDVGRLSVYLLACSASASSRFFVGRKSGIKKPHSLMKFTSRGEVYPAVPPLLPPYVSYCGISVRHTI